jgi:hypothetical protein
LECDFHDANRLRLEAAIQLELSTDCRVDCAINRHPQGDAY